ncbi:NADPH dehydrogenase [Posidoniimonas polymericola]|uniref:NADPH dehydrogenase n=1 Tax=Posidoniimonas polymericola TaxID=2528002 RepID=A0A5C5YAG9_9BACT|nr:NADH:flavin oxidoreductase [Posidoniimonas polymericola]TWT72677.1 NADPH dehydrogenase [Posidoniimonas polymericola]
MPAPKYPRVASLKTAADFLTRLKELGVVLPFDEQVEAGDASPLGQSLPWSGGVIGNRFCILPMEGWDGETDGRPTELTKRRWRNFGVSGAKLLWGGEAVAVQPEGRANPNQLMINDHTLAGIEELRTIALDAHRERFGTTDDLLLGLQLTHSGRFARPNDKKRIEPRVGYRHPVLDKKFNVTDDAAILSDDELDRLVDDFIAAAKLAHKVGYTFVDVKHCHGYLGHELLSGFDRLGKYGGDFEGRTRFVRRITDGIRAEAPGLAIGVRLSVFDFTPFEPGDENVGRPSADAPYGYAFGGDGTALGIDLTEPKRFLELLKNLGIDLLCSTAGSPYYNPHIQRPAYFPPSDGYLPPEDPLVGVARQIAATAELKAAHPNTVIVGSGYSYLQDWLPNVGQAAVRSGMIDSVGLGRMVLSYPDLPADVLAGQTMQRKKICRTFSDCTTAPRNGIVSGCYPLDPFYKEMPEREELNKIKKETVPT